MKFLKFVLLVAIFLQSVATASGQSTTNLKPRHQNTVIVKKRHKRKLSSFTDRRKYPHYHDNDCIFVNGYNLARRLKEYPFSEAVKILAVSHRDGAMPNQDINIDGDTSKQKVYDTLAYGLNVQNGILNKTSLIEIKTLNKQQISRLTNLLYNTTYKRKNNILDPGADCFNPRNAFIFYDKDGKVFDYLDVCFECNQMVSLSNRILFKSDCNQQLDYLKKYFISIGIKYGTIHK